MNDHAPIIISLRLTKCRVVLDGERHIECLKPVPMEGMPRLDFRFQTTYVTRKRNGGALVSEFTATMEHPETGEIYYRCWCTAFAIMTKPVAPFADLGTSQSIAGTKTGPIEMPKNRWACLMPLQCDPSIGIMIDT